MKTIALVLAVAGLAAVQATCPNMCSGHGSCTADDSCRCWMGYMGYDCSQRACPYVEGWAENHEESAHFYAECAGKGICDRSSGSCNCFDGYEGRGCERSSCPNGCSGNGVCRLISDLGNYVSGKSGWTSYSWDEKAITACVCDGGFMGPDCSERYCPFGDDPMTVCEQGDVEQVQRVRFTLPGQYYGSALNGADLENDEAALRFTASDGSVLYTGGFNGVFGKSNAAGDSKTSVAEAAAEYSSVCFDGISSYTDIASTGITLTNGAGDSTKDTETGTVGTNLALVSGTGLTVDTTAAGGVVTAIAINAAGSGYAAGEFVVAQCHGTPGAGTKSSYQITAVDASGGVLGLRIINGGTACDNGGLTAEATAARGATISLTAAAGAYTAIDTFVLSGEVFTEGDGDEFTVGDGSCDSNTAVSATASASSAATAATTAITTALESLPNFYVKDVTVTHTSSEYGYNSNVDSGNSLRNNFYVTFHHVDSGNSFGAQSLLTCPHARNVGTYTTFGCGAAGCQPKVLQPRAVTTSVRNIGGNAVATAAQKAAIGFTSDSVLTCPAGKTCNAGASVHQGAIEVALVNHAGAAGFASGMGVWVGSKGHTGPRSFTGNCGANDAADYGAVTGAATLIADPASCTAQHSFGFKFYGNIADYPVDPSDATKKIVDISAVMADTKLSIVDPAVSGAADAAADLVLGTASSGYAAIVELAFTTAQCEATVDVTTTATEGAEVAFQNLDVENQECSGRGQCDRSSGQCACFEGYHGLSCNTQTILI